MKTINKRSSNPRVLLCISIVVMLIITFITSSFSTKTVEKLDSNRSSIAIDYKDGKKFYILLDGMNNPVAFIKDK